MEENEKLHKIRVELEKAKQEKQQADYKSRESFEVS
jgi:hypothetical protein